MGTYLAVWVSHPTLKYPSAPWGFNNCFNENVLLNREYVFIEKTLIQYYKILKKIIVLIQEFNKGFAILLLLIFTEAWF